MALTPSPPPIAQDSPFTDAASMQAYIVARSRQLNLDPRAVLSVAAHEGITLPAKVGDNGTSFGPWQLHIGGALPASVAQKGTDYANQWANSPAGVDYALSRIAQVAGGQTGGNAIANIVNKFERPKDPGGEISRAISTYNKGTPMLPKGPSVVVGAGGGPVGAAVDAGKTVVDAALAVPKFLGKLTDPHNMLRALQIVAGAVLILVGLYLLARQVGLAFEAPSPVRAAAAAVPSQE